METTAIGAAFAAGLAVGVWSSTDELKDLWSVAEVWNPSMETAKRMAFLAGWKKAVSKSLDWVSADDDSDCNETDGFMDAVSDPDEPSSAPPDSANIGGLAVSKILLVGGALCVGFLLGRRRR